MKLLINQVDEHNEANIISSVNIKVDSVLYIYTEKQRDLLNNIESYYINNIKDVKFCSEEVKIGEYEALNNIINKYKAEELVINLTGGERINSLILLALSIKNNIKCIYMNIKDKKYYEFIGGISINDINLDDLDIESIIKFSGGKIVEDSTALCDKEDLIYLSREIYKHLDIWGKYKQLLYDINIFKHDINNPKKIYINKDNIPGKKEKSILRVIINKLVEMKEIIYKEEKDNIEVEFQNDYIKGFIFKSGTWLEIATNTLIKKIKEIDESKNGVVFLWNKENQILRNELDVVAVKDSIPICISCKDSDKYNEMALNELNVYAGKIGGENAYKILVATREPIKSPVRDRAKEMGIHIVIFDGDEEKFIHTISNIINEIKNGTT